MASQLYSHIVIKNEVYGDSQNVLLDSSMNLTDSYDEVKHAILSALKQEEPNAMKQEEPSAMKQEEPSATSPQLDLFCSNSCCDSEQTPAAFPSPLRKIHTVTLQESGVGQNQSIVKKLLQSTLPKKHIGSKWTKHTTESILWFLRSFLTVARSSRFTHCADVCIALNGPQTVKCEECFLEFSGLYDRYLKLFTHYKTSHRFKCNVLIGQKWLKQKSSLDIMVAAWKLDLKYELRNSCALSDLRMV